MIHPNQFKVNEAWIAFKLNDAPIITDRDGDFNMIALMDAASCFILSTLSVSAMAVQLTELESKELLKNGWIHKQELPKTLIIPCLLYTSPSPRDRQKSRMPSSA